MEKVYLQVNLPNFITVVLMTAVGFALSGMIVAFLRKNLPTTGA